MPTPVRSPKTFPLCHHDGALVPWETATLHAASLALRYAVSVFEGIRIYRTADGRGTATASEARMPGIQHHHLIVRAQMGRRRWQRKRAI